MCGAAILYFFDSVSPLLSNTQRGPSYECYVPFQKLQDLLTPQPPRPIHFQPTPITKLSLHFHLARRARQLYKPAATIRIWQTTGQRVCVPCVISKTGSFHEAKMGGSSCRILHSLSIRRVFSGQQQLSRVPVLHPLQPQVW